MQRIFFQRQSVNFGASTSVISGKQKVPKHFQICCCTHGGAQTIVNAVGYWAARVVKSGVSRQALDQK